ncbi:flavin reductase family protein [Hydrogenimonas thermophila]|uniref:NADH-FMN oxidoreductase RutF, flavin reductase (DIM6/NTAB) family n=1 Tax=Hydrogenimonas thermophila TaxID=223786 RepID=A0A1I5UP59_9BACT|nr:flavin reductase family protein [Hydrogenimonas thermophila]SFP97084.1 NADH-FMN oxidoreductase RutF, flavin reductase (DIM6/NTAB) family [Hydrogenimonas thermophila]
MIFDYTKTKPLDNYKLMSQTIIPRPIAWVVTENEGIVNVAPFSYFTGLSSNPPTMIISIGHKSDGMPKDTLANIRKNKKCTVCLVKPEQLESMHFSSKEMAHSESESEAFNIPMKKLIDGFPPMVDGSPAAFFCELYQEVDLKGSKTIPLIVEIKQQFIDDSCIKDIERLMIDYEPLARVGKSYALLSKEITPPQIP